MSKGCISRKIWTDTDRHKLQIKPVEFMLIDTSSTVDYAIRATPDKLSISFFHSFSEECLEIGDHRVTIPKQLIHIILL